MTENKNKEKEYLDNIIIGNIYIKEDNLTKRIINSYENVNNRNHITHMVNQKKMKKK